jgi:hypothetical protein
MEHSAEYNSKPCKCGHYIGRVTDEWWWCGACGRLAKTAADVIKFCLVPNPGLKGVSLEDMRPEDGPRIENEAEEGPEAS